MLRRNFLRAGLELEAELSHQRCRLLTLIGEGGQAEVWSAELDHQLVALKWFKPVQLERDPDTYSRIQTLLRIPAPSRAFLWPIDTVRSEKLPGFGYVMPLLPSNFVNLDMLLKCAAPSPHPRIEALICYNLATEFGRLHRLDGMAYRDINTFNVYFDTLSGNVCIIDNDNVSVNGSPSVLRGLSGFMAPELECDATQQTSRYTDLHSLAVIFFRLLMRGDPFVGAFELYQFANEQERRMALYGLYPLFVFHPDDERNRPLRGRHDQMLTRWAYQPRFLRERFVDAFVHALANPTARVTHAAWQHAMLQLHDAYFECRRCTAQHFYDAHEIAMRGGNVGSCWHCQTPLRLPPRIRITTGARLPHFLLLEHGLKLRPHHLAHTNADFQRVMGIYQSRPPALRNLTGEPWMVRTEHGDRLEIAHGDALDLSLRSRVKLGDDVVFETQPADPD